MMIRGNKRNRCSGVVIVWIVLAMMVLIGMVGLTCDWLRLRLISQQLQHAADAAALAGGQKLRVGTFSTAREWASLAAGYNRACANPVTLQLNGDNSAGGDIVIGRYYKASQTFVATNVGVNAVLTRAHRPDGGAPVVDLLFGGMFGTDTATLARDAVATNPQGIGMAILALTPRDRAFTSQGTSTLRVLNGSIQINSDHTDAVKSETNSSQVLASDFNICSETADVPRNLDGNYNSDAPPIPDPLAAIRNDTFEDVKANPQTIPAGDNVVLNPGYYTEQLSVSNGKSVTLNSGTYVFGEGIKMTGGTFVAHEVTMFVTNSKDKAAIDITGGVVDITPPTSGRYEHVSLFQDPKLTKSSAGASIEGNPDISIKGTIYVPGNSLSISGTGGAIGNQIIANLVSFGGTGVFTVDYDGAFAPPGRSYLIE